MNGGAKEFKREFSIGIKQTINFKNHHIRRQIDLRLKDLVASEFNLTLDQVWNYAPIVQPWAWPPQRMIICATLNPPQRKAPKQGQMKVIFEALENSDGKF